MNPNNPNNWVQFQHGGTQYGSTGSAAYPTPAQQSYNYGAPQQRPDYATGQTYPTPSQTYPSAPQPTYDYGYGRPPQTYDQKTYYQQPGTSYVAQGYPDPNSAAKATYAQQPQRAPMQQKVTQYSASYAGPATAAVAANKQPSANAASAPQYSTSYDNAVYQASVYMAQQAKGNPVPTQTTNWQQKKGASTFKRQKPAPANKVQQVHYCDVCRISCAGPQTYREHLEGQKHKKREALQKAQQDGQPANPALARGSNLRCELCDVTCTGSDAYAAHVRGSKHQKVVKLHTKLGKPIPSTEPTAVASPKEGVKAPSEEVEPPPSEDIKPVGEEYIEEIKDAEGKVTTFNCKLCDCKFNDPNAKEMHTKGRRHRLQYKKKVQPDLVVDVKPTLRQRKMAEREKQRQQMQDDVWTRRQGDMEDDERLYWEQRRFEEECGGGNEMGPWNRGFPRMPGPGRPMGFPPNFNNGRRIESLDDRHVITRHAEIYPKEEELQSIQRIVSHTERALKLVSDAMTEKKASVSESKLDEKMETQSTSSGSVTNGETEQKDGDTKSLDSKENGTQQSQMISFQKDTEGTIRILKGVMRVGLLAKGLLLQGDSMVQLVVLCAEKPTSTVLKRVVNEFPLQLKKVSEEHKYSVTMAPVEGAVLVTDGSITVKVSLTSPLLREAADANTETVANSEDLLPKEPCLQALAALRHSKWFQARATSLQSCVMIMRIFRDMCQRIPTFTPLNQWAMELLIEKVISSAGMPLSPGDCLRRVMEALASGILIQGPGLMDPCEKEPADALKGLTKQQREDITVTAQQFLRYIAFRQIHKVLGMDPLPMQKYQGNRPWKFNASRKRRRSGTEPSDTDGQKMVKKEGENSVGEVSSEKMETETK